MLRTVKLHNKLGQDFGEEHKIDANTMHVIVAGLSYNDITLQQTLRQGKHVVILQDGDGTKEEDYFPMHPDFLRMNLDKYHTVHIIPLIEGEGPILMIGAAIGAIGIGVTMAAGATFLGLAAASWIMMGVSFALSGISALLAPSPEMPDPLRAQEDQTGAPSFLFNGAVNVVEQGGSVPIVYGETRVGSTVISAGMTTEDIPV